MQIPTQLTAGDSVSWRDPALTAQGVGISPTAWGLSYSLRGPLAAGVDLIGASDGTRWSFTLTAAQTAAFNASPSTLLWYWQASATFATQRITVARGVLRVKPNLALLATSATFDGRSQAEKNLVAIETEIQARIEGGATLEYTIGQRSLKREPMEALMALRTQWRRIVAGERRGRQPGRSDLQITQVQFR
jgi:hypothetical protein